MPSSVFHRLKLWLSDLRLELVLCWHSVRAAVAERIAPSEYEIQVEWTPLYRGQPFRNSEPEPKPEPTAAACHCINCSHRGSVLMADGAEPIDPDTEIFDMLECPECGLFTMCSD
jgi:hypothetical protein